MDGAPPPRRRRSHSDASAAFLSRTDDRRRRSDEIFGIPLWKQPGSLPMFEPVAEKKAIPPAAFSRLDETPDEIFYSVPRFVQHIDEGAIAAVTDLYRRLFPPGAAILDLCSSWVSHLPPEICYRRVVGIGMNAEELAENPFLDEWHVQNLNADPRLPFADGEFDAAAICVSVQYLTRPIEVLRDVGRVLRPGSPLVVAFSDRCFPTRAIACWRMLDDEGHVHLVGHYLAQAGNWRDARCFHHCPHEGDPLHAVIAYSTGPYPPRTEEET